MNEVEQVHKLLDAAGIEHIEENGVFICIDGNGHVAKITNYADDESLFQVTLNGMKPEQAVAALSATIAHVKED